jgi:hypothetical protein
MPSSHCVTHVFPRGQGKIAAAPNKRLRGKKTDNPAEARGNQTGSAARLDEVTGLLAMAGDLGQLLFLS